MARYVVKNAHDKWLSYDYDGRWWAWASDKESRHTWSYKPDAFAKARSNGGKVYRLRRPSAKGERRDVVKFIDGLTRQETGMLRAVFSDVAKRIAAGEHRRAK